MVQLELRLRGVHKCAGDFDLRVGDRHSLLGTDYGDGRKIICVRTPECEHNETPHTWVCPELSKGSGEVHPFDWSVAPDKNEELCVDIALDVMCSKGQIDPEYVDDELTEELQRLYREGPELLRTRISFKDGDILWNMSAARTGEYLADLWEHEQHLRWQREEAPRWECEYCETLLGYYEFWRGRGSFYSLTDAGEFKQEVTACPGCGRDVHELISRNGQLELLDARPFTTIHEGRS